jgi:serine/threonine protein kinase/Tol biopolymer transport system component
MAPEMTADRWQTIDRVFHSTLECAPEKRANFLRQACGDDQALRAEVESLLRAHEQDGSFLDLPAYEVAADFLTDALGGLFAGQQIGPYKILSPLAAGGMGEVYLAQDTRLGRKIALKLLPPDFARDQHRVRRFAQEARAASALNHPNVCVIHEVGKTTDGRHFIAMELIDGITLRERISQGPLSLVEALTVAEQVAAALTAAHAAGVIHRDIKPENIMLHREGYAKVLDFGLAKVNDSHSERNRINEDSTMAHVNTEPGTQMGTVRYMSPEHLRERPVDERADIWSFGVVLHEMVTGVTPFEARTRNEVVALILKRQPAKLRFFDDVPAEFTEMVAKALNKHREQRYQTISDLAADLKSLRRKLTGETSAEPLRMLIQSGRAKQRSAKGSDSATRHTPPGQTHAPSDVWKSALTYISHTAEHVLSGIKGHPRTTAFAGLTAVVAIFFGLYSPSVGRWFRLQPPPVPPSQAIKMTPLTNSGQSICAAISPDGKWFAHAEKKDGKQELLVTNIASGGNSIVVPASDLKYRGIVFSRDAYYLYFTAGERNESGVLYQVAFPGGTPKKVKDGVDSSITFSPTGDRFAFVRLNVHSGDYSLMITGIDGSGERSIATRQKGERFSVWGPAWSPDGQTIVCGAGKWDQGYQMRLIGVNVADGREKQIGNKQWYFISQVAWSGEKNDLIVSAIEQWGGAYQLWRVSYPEGESFRLTSEIANTGFDNVSVSQDGSDIVAVQNRQVAQIWIAPDGNAQRARAITSIVGITYGLDWSSSNKIVVSSMVKDNLHLTAIDPDGAKAQLTNVGNNGMPAVSPDGRLIVFASNRTGSLNIWRMNANDGSDPRQLTFSDGNSYPAWSADGRWVVYDNHSEGAWSAWKVSIEGGSPIQLADHARMPVVSPDNQFVAYRHYPEGGAPEITIMPFEGGAPVRQLPIPVRDWQRLQWTPDSRALTYIDISDGVSNIWSYDLAANAKKQLTDFKSDQIFGYAWSRDFKQLACERGTMVGDVAIINSRK